MGSVMEAERPLDDVVISLQGALSRLTSPDVIVVHDHEGREYRLAGALPARRQVRVFASFGELLETALVQLQSAELSGASLLRALVRALSDDALVEKVGAAFTAAYPNAIGERDPLDTFPLEEMLAALLPHFARFVRRSGSLFGDIAT